MDSFVPDDFVVPSVLESDRFRLRMLSVTDVDLDYDAVMSSCKRLRSVFDPDDDWPADNMTLETNLEDLTRHQDEFERRVAFAYTVMNPEETRCLGCLYICPTRREDYDTVVFMWVRDSEFETGGDEELFALVRSWLTECWPFESVAYPGREIPWDKWKRD